MSDVVKFTVTIETDGPKLTRQNIRFIESKLMEAIVRQSENACITPDDYDGFTDGFSVEFQEE